MYWFNDSLVYLFLVQKYRYYLEKLKYARVVFRLSLATFLLMILAVAIPFALDGNQTVSYAGDEATVQQAATVNQPTKTPEPKAAPTPVVAPDPTPVVSPKGLELQAAINSWVATHGGNVAVTVRGIDDPTIKASYQGDAKMYTASIYKLFVIELAYNHVNAGTWTTAQGGLNLDDCVRRMILVSDNNCAVAYGNLLGWQASDAELHGQGYAGTSLNINHPWSTANDVAELLVRLENGTLVSSAQREGMLGYMKQQIYRSGIPAANSGIDVADKVGFFDTYNTDAGIVYGPSGKYALSIMTNGVTFADIADLANVVAGVMNK